MFVKHNGVFLTIYFALFLWLVKLPPIVYFTSTFKDLFFADFTLSKSTILRWKYKKAVRAIFFEKKCSFEVSEMDTYSLFCPIFKSSLPQVFLCQKSKTLAGKGFFHYSPGKVLKNIAVFPRFFSVFVSSNNQNWEYQNREKRGPSVQKSFLLNISKVYFRFTRSLTRREKDNQARMYFIW